MAEFPTAIRKALQPVDPHHLPGPLAIDGRECAGAKFHSPNPLTLYEVSAGVETIYLCGTCRANYMVLNELIQHHGELPWPVRREFGNRLRALLIPKETDG